MKMGGGGGREQPGGLVFVFSIARSASRVETVGGGAIGKRVKEPGSRDK